MRVVGGMYLNIVLIVVCFVASVLLSLLINVFICTQLLQNALCKFLLTCYTNLRYDDDDDD